MLTLAMLVKFGFNEKWIFWAIPVGSFLSGIYALYFFFILGERPFLYHGYMVIQTGGMCALLGTLSAVIYFYAINKKYIWLERVALWSASFGMIATLLSGARGAWVLTPFVLLGLIWHFKTTLNKQRILTLLVHSIVIIGISLPQIHSRTNEAAEELTDYNQAQISIQTNTEQENLIEKDQPKNSTHTNTETKKLANYNQPQKNTSLGIRIELWKSAIYSFIEKPIIGQGLNNIEESKRIQIEQGLVDPLVLNSTRAHNQFLEEMQTKGLIGLTALLTLFFVPLLTFRKLYNKNKHNYFALMGEVHIILIMGFCLTQHYLNHHSGLLVFTFGTVILASAALKKEGDTIRDEFS
jgi:O-antigen ligase